ncbi:hypothetical protein [Spirillospora sp. NPDC029432]|uniref:hypothetical protein n=1 Tax=Spirillospora sp. NPDC029432 TaxID=3154599 RepID=UPI003456D335
MGTAEPAGLILVGVLLTAPPALAEPAAWSLMNAGDRRVFVSPEAVRAGAARLVPPGVLAGGARPPSGIRAFQGKREPGSSEKESRA